MKFDSNSFVKIDLLVYHLLLFSFLIKKVNKYKYNRSQNYINQKQNK